MPAYNFKTIRTVPPGKEIIDIILSKTQRQTPTVIHQGYAIQRIRAFYMRKVKFTSETVCDRLDRILQDFPKLDDLHPFYADLCNVLYDRDHYKLALGQINVAKHLVSNVNRDYVRMLKYGDSLYRCKQLKRAALGRMCTILKKQSATLSYLEEVRKHLGRLPSIDPNSRTLLVTGFPNVGKSSFMNQITHADVDVQPYAFTTKSLFVGHMDYKYLRWQVIDSPGVLDKPLEERNTIEMQAITAIAHLPSVVLYFFDVSEQCGWNLEAQAELFISLKPLFVNKPLIVVANKVDVIRLQDMDPSKRELIERLAKESKAPLLPMSAMNAVGVTNVKRSACEALLEKRVEVKSKRVSGVLNKISVTMPTERDTIQRGHSIPDSVFRQRQEEAQTQSQARQNFQQTQRNAYLDEIDAQEAETNAVHAAMKDWKAQNIKSRGKTAKEVMWEQGGPGAYSVDLREHYQLFNQEWTYDSIPEIMNGKNVSDFVDPAIEAKLLELEREEEEFSMQRMEDNDEDSDLDEEEKELFHQIRDQRLLAKTQAQTRKKLNGKRMPRIALESRRTKEDLQESLSSKGFEVSQLRHGTRKRPLTSPMEQVEEEEDFLARVRKQGRHDPNPDEIHQDPRRGLRTGEVYADATQKQQALKKFHQARKLMRSKGHYTEGDRFSTPKLVKHMVTGKRGIGKTQRR